MKTQSKSSMVRKRITAARVSVILTLLTACSGSSKVMAAADDVGSQDHRIVGTRIEAGPTDRELTLIFAPTPSTGLPPVVRLLRTASRAKTLEVQSDSSGYYSARLGDIQDVSNGQLLIEMSDAQKDRYSLHSAEFALHEIAINGPSSSPSRDGHFVLYTTPSGIAPGSRLLISSGELPIEALPAGVSSSTVIGAYFVDLLSPVAKTEDWRLAIAILPETGKATLFYLAKGAKTWNPLESERIEGRPLQDAAFAGPGTYLLVRGAKR